MRALKNNPYRGSFGVNASVYSDSFVWERKQIKAWLRTAGANGLSSTEIGQMVQATCATWVRAAVLHLEDLAAKGEVICREQRWFLADTAGSGAMGVVGSDTDQGSAQFAQPKGQG